MSLSSAFNIINTAFNANAAQTAITSNNVANANTTGYSLKTANLATNSFGGVEITSVTRATNVALQDQMLAANSESAAQSARVHGHDHGGGAIARRQACEPRERASDL